MKKEGIEKYKKNYNNEEFEIPEGGHAIESQYLCEMVRHGGNN